MFQSIKDTTKEMKEQPTEWDKVFANHIYDKEFASRIYKELLKPNLKKNLIFIISKKNAYLFLQIRYPNEQ